MENEDLNTEQTKSNTEEEQAISQAQEIQETQLSEEPLQGSHGFEDSMNFAPNDPFAPPKEHTHTTGEMPFVPVVSAEDAANPEIGGDIEVERATKRKTHPILRGFATFITFLLIAFGAACAWLIYDDSNNASNHVPNGVTLDGESVSGMTDDKVKALVEKHVRMGSIDSTVLDVNGQKFKLDSANVGDVNIDGTVEAVMSTIEKDRIKRCINRALGFIGKAPEMQEISLKTICAVDEAKVRARVASIAVETDTEPVDAGYDYDDQRHTLIMTSAEPGQSLNVNETTSVVMDASERGLATVSAVVSTVKPEKSKAGYGVFVNLSRCYLYLYKDGKQVATYACSPGPKKYPTPSGNWIITAKEEEPVWNNPHTEWSAKRPETIAPGENNPLGLRALELSGGVYIHGTNAYGKLGKPRGHGDIAIGNNKVVELFDLVEVGTPVFVR